MKAALLFCVVLVACSDDPKKRGIGSTCELDEECQSGLCLESKCFDPERDDDQDSLVNRVEAKLGTSPTKADTDEDGIADRDELSATLEPIDTDGDGIIDALESNVLDQDFDCHVDQLDVQNTVKDPVGCELPDDIQVDCLAHKVNRQQTGLQYIDPDLTGPVQPFEVNCEGTALGGWTQLKAGVVPFTDDTVSEFLFTNPAAWLRTPPVSSGWSWTAASSAPGTWVWSSAQGVGIFACDGSLAPDGVGVACNSDIGGFRVSALDTELGTVRLCVDSGIGPYPLDENGCIDDLQVYWRRVACGNGDGELVGDKGFATLADSNICWTQFATDAVASPSDDVPPNLDGSSLAIAGQGALLWDYALQQVGMTYVADHRYRLGVWLRATGQVSGHIIATDAAGNRWLDETIPIDETWRYFERGFTPGASAFTGGFSLQLQGNPGAFVYVFDMSVRELESDACLPDDGNGITMDGNLDYNVDCWRVYAGSGPAVFVGTEADAAPDGEETPYVRLTSTGFGSPEAVYLEQTVPALGTDRRYAMKGFFQSESATVRMTVSDGDGTYGDDELVLNQPGWFSFYKEFVIHGPPHSLVGTTFQVRADLATPGSLALDDVAVVDVGANPCVSIDPDDASADPGFDDALLCWEPTIVNAGLGTFGYDPAMAGPSGSAPAMHWAPGTPSATPDDARLVQSGLALTAGRLYGIDFWAYAESDTVMTVVLTNGTDVTRQDVNVPGGQWSQYGYDFEPTVSTDDGHFELLFGATGVNVWVDDARVYLQTF